MSGRRLSPWVPVFILLLQVTLAGSLPSVLEAQRVSSAPTAWFFPEGTSFDASIPSPEAFLGYEVGAFHTRHDRIVAYFQTLAALSDRVTYQEIGMTHGHRVLPVVTITSSENHARLAGIQADHLEAIRLAGEGRPIPAGLLDRPVIMHLGYGVHGNETSSSEAAMLVGYWLAAGTSAEVQEILARGVYNVEPVLNPDGRDRHTHWANMHRANALVADPLDREHNEAWPGGRTNHYWFDLNRDWFPLEHPESRARIEFHHAWMPNIVTDYHEMGTNSTYFFEPTKPLGSWNPLIPEFLYRDLTELLAERWAESLDAIGALYFTKEVFDNTYPGYGSTYPNYLGGLGLVFEQASSRGHVQASTHHGELTFAFTIRNQVRTSLATVQGGVSERSKFLRYQEDFFREGLAESRALPTRGWVFGDPADPALDSLFIDLLLRHRIQVYELGDSVAAGGRTWSPGSGWLVPTEQPQVRLVRSIFETTDTYADSVFYDASTWTMSLAYGVAHAPLRGRLPRMGAQVRAPSLSPIGSGALPEPRVGYLLEWTHHFSPRALQYLLSRGVRVEAAQQPFTARTHQGLVAFGAGTISIPVSIQSMNPETLHQLVVGASGHAGVPFHAVDTGYSAQGIDLGSGSFRPIPHAPRTLMVVGQGVAANEAGQVWHLLDTRVDLPLVKIDQGQMGRVRFHDYDVMILVSGSYPSLAGETLESLRRWVQDGGTLIGIRGGAQWATSQGFAPRVRQAMEDRTPLPPSGLVGRTDYADARDLTGAQQIGGSIYRADLDLTHPLGFGYRKREIAVWRDHSFIFPESANPFSTPVRLTSDPHLSGYISPVNLDRIRGSASVLADGIGDGTTVLLLDNPVFRGYWYGTNRLLLNAIYFGQHITIPAAP